MEEKKDYRQQNVQKFYFNDDGQLVVETNKGKWVDGEQFAEMRGIFTCNARTMGAIIAYFKQKPIVVKEIAVHNCICLNESISINETRQRFTEYCAIVNPSDDDKELMCQIEAKNKNIDTLKKCVKEMEKHSGEDGDKIHKLEKSIKDFNALPWYKRIFKKIEIK